jgi:hypothetical protein
VFYYKLLMKVPIDRILQSHFCLPKFLLRFHIQSFTFLTSLLADITDSCVVADDSGKGPRLLSGASEGKSKR